MFAMGFLIICKILSLNIFRFTEKCQQIARTFSGFHQEKRAPLKIVY